MIQTIRAILVSNTQNLSDVSIYLNPLTIELLNRPVSYTYHLSCQTHYCASDYSAPAFQ